MLQWPHLISPFSINLSLNPTFNQDSSQLRDLNCFKAMFNKTRKVISHTSCKFRTYQHTKLDMMPNFSRSLMNSLLIKVLTLIMNILLCHSSLLRISTVFLSKAFFRCHSINLTKGTSVVEMLLTLHICR